MIDDIKRKCLRKVLKTAARKVRLEVKGKKEMMELCSVQSTHIYWHLWVTKGCSSYCYPDFILLVLHSGFRFTERLQREIQLSMVGSCRTWNKDEPGLGRTKALPSSVPCRVAVIWKVLSGRCESVNVHLYTSYCTQWHGHVPPSQIHHTPTVQACAYTPLIRPLSPDPHPITTTTTTILCFLALSFSSTLFFLQGHFESWICCWMCCAFTGGQIFAPAMQACVCGCEFIVCPSVFGCPSVWYDDHACEVPTYRYFTCISDSCSSLLSVLSSSLAIHTYSGFSFEVNRYRAVHEKKMAAST